MKKHTYTLLATFSFIVVMIIGSDVLASPPGGGGGPSGQGGCIPPPCVPIDGVIALGSCRCCSWR